MLIYRMPFISELKKIFLKINFLICLKFSKHKNLTKAKTNIIINFFKSNIFKLLQKAKMNVILDLLLIFSFKLEFNAL